MLTTVFFLVCNIRLMHSALFHNAAACNILREVACSHFVESHFTKFSKNCSHGLCCIPVSLIVGMNYISDFNLIAFNPAVVDKANDFTLKIDSVFKVLCIFYFAENNQLFCQFLSTPHNIYPCKNSLRLSFRLSSESIHIRPDKHSPLYSLPLLR